MLICCPISDKMVLSVVSACLIADYLYPNILRKPFAFYLSLSVSFISTSIAQPYCMVYTGCFTIVEIKRQLLKPLSMTLFIFLFPDCHREIVNLSIYYTKNSLMMPWQMEQKIFCVKTYYETKSFQIVQARFRRKFSFNKFPNRSQSAMSFPLHFLFHEF